MILAIRRLAAEAIAAKIRRDHREPLREIRCDLVPDDTGLRKAVEQEQRRSGPCSPNVNGRASRGYLASLESWQEVLHLGVKLLTGGLNATTSFDDVLASVVPSPDAAAALQMHAAQPAIDAAHRDPVLLTGQHRPAGVRERHDVTEVVALCGVSRGQA